MSRNRSALRYATTSIATSMAVVLLQVLLWLIRAKLLDSWWMRATTRVSVLVAAALKCG
jgi:hypothetical protein